MSLLERLRLNLDREAAAGRTARLGAGCRTSAAAGTLSAAVTTGGGSFEQNPDNAVLMTVRCGHEPGVLLVICHGNYKDEACTVASGCAATSFIDTFGAGLISEADVVPALRRSILAADRSIREISEREPRGASMHTCMGLRKDLSGIGTCVTAAFALPTALFVAHVGDARAVLVRAGTTRQLTIDHTLAYEPAYRRLEATSPGEAFPSAGDVVLRALGTGPEPRIDVTRVALEAADSVVVGNSALRYAVEAGCDLTRIGGDPVEACDRIAEAMRRCFWQAPATLGVVTLGA